ncbi:dTDP-4-dehydrorhamnose reductase [Maribacter dokdonensis]|uniref:dTDP-4-dehydrorhamnose reductase n=1 Tax=Maribacter dokdonensis TaxID=320912 RepID=UPI001C0A304C|nr:dTDP-4-dehydrorhamnose reductase [Maribacter dokdonensis]MBU2900558.1 dTDP-4-dehydrorhamnose reductase [Maribacter dokdonensis]
MKKVLVTGANGQLGQCLQKIAPSYKELNFIFKSSKELDITDILGIEEAFVKGNFNYCINCAAYTNVEQAEKTPDIAYKVNAEGVKNLANVCKSYKTTLIHISTDYVFDGEKDEPYTVKDVPNPINEYGKSKLLGEKHIQEIMDNYCIIRTSWLYNKTYGNNFYRTILKKAQKGEILHITNKEKGCPTNTVNLSKFVLDLIVKEYDEDKIHHYTDGEVMTWFSFAKRIIKERKLNSVIIPKDYKTKVARPRNSVLN